MGLGEAPESWGTGKHCQDLLWGIRGPDLPPGHRCIPHLQRHQAGWDARPEGAPFSSSTPPIQLPVSTGSDPLHQCPEVVLSFFLIPEAPPGSRPPSGKDLHEEVMGRTPRPPPPCPAALPLCGASAQARGFLPHFCHLLLWALHLSSQVTL